MSDRRHHRRKPVQELSDRAPGDATARRQVHGAARRHRTRGPQLRAQGSRCCPRPPDRPGRRGRGILGAQATSASRSSKARCSASSAATAPAKARLLKILSRITEPTEGRVALRGRVASLLEVGTGFHPELTGRENIFLNGAILGMTRAGDPQQVRRDRRLCRGRAVSRHAGQALFVSGMYVRLAFAVAAHLEPEILIVDEVLAVGDAEFQKKCLGKMDEVSRQQGRTVLFVSHNMEAVPKLCTRGIFFQVGRVKATGDAKTGGCDLPE